MADLPWTWGLFLCTGIVPQTLFQENSATQKTEVNHNLLHMGQPTAIEYTKSTLKHAIEMKILYGATFPHQQVLRLSWFRGINKYVYKMRSSRALKAWRSVTAKVWLKVQNPQCLSMFNTRRVSTPSLLLSACPWKTAHIGNGVNLQFPTRFVCPCIVIHTRHKRG